MLKYIGKGSCFNIKEINNSAYYKDHKYLLIIDCGETVATEILKIGLLNDIEEVDILITHFHSDHIGSLPTLLFYLTIILKIIPNIIYEETDKMTDYLLLSGNDLKTLNIIKPADVKNIKVQSVKQNHSQFINAYGYLININDQIIYFSGDSKNINEEILRKFKNKQIDYFYQDVSKYCNDAHLNIEDLKNLIPQDKRKKINCMHLDDDELRESLVKMGFIV
ncbi:MAG: MBL fold metallo-hydrolase [Bacilli bacterium]|nr:MBL fold metallo-hydrolase [Bacilli bacterium]